MAVPGLGFRLFGFPVRVEPWFVVVAAVLGWNSDSTIGSLLVWIAVVFVSVLVHELGHAVAARSRGADPVRIDLYGFGGLTRFSPRRPLGRVEAAGISLAGPFSGMALGGVVALIVAVVGLPDGDLPEFAVRAALWVNLGWGLINLLPVLPLDGGHVLTAVLPGDEGARHTRAAWASVVIGAAAAVAFFAIGLPFGAMLFVMFAASNLATARSAPSSCCT